MKNVCVRQGDEEPCRVAVPVALYFSRRELWGILVVSNGTECRSIQQSPIVYVQNKDGRLRSGHIDFVERWHASLCELKFCPTANHAHPLWSWSSRRLILQHLQRVCERQHAVPAQLHVVVHAAADRMYLRIVPSGNDGSSFSFDHPCTGP